MESFLCEKLTSAIGDFALNQIYNLLSGLIASPDIGNDVAAAKIKALVTSHQDKVDKKLDKVMRKELISTMALFEDGKSVVFYSFLSLMQTISLNLAHLDF